MSQIPPEWSEAQFDQWQSLYADLEPFRGQPVTDEHLADGPASSAVVMVEETFAVQLPDEPPVYLQLLWPPRLASTTIFLWPQVSLSSADFYLDDGHAVVLTHAARELVLFVQRHFPGTAMTVRYSPAESDERFA